MTPAVAQALAALAGAVARLETAAARASEGWSSLLGAESSAAALREDARQARKLYETLAAKAERIVAGSAAERAFLQDVQPFLDTREQEQLAGLLTVGGAVRDVGAATLRDVKAGLRFGLPLLAVALVVAAVYFLPRGS